MNWTDEAACTTVDPEIFFPEPSIGWHPNKDAKQICAGCPVKQQCLDATRNDRWSIRGGLTGNERSKLRGQADDGADESISRTEAA